MKSWPWLCLALPSWARHPSVSANVLIRRSSIHGLMKHKRPPVPVIVILVLAVLVGGYFGIRALLNKTEALR